MATKPLEWAKEHLPNRVTYPIANSLIYGYLTLEAMFERGERKIHKSNFSNLKREELGYLLSFYARTDWSVNEDEEFFVFDYDNLPSEGDYLLEKPCKRIIKHVLIQDFDDLLAKIRIFSEEMPEFEFSGEYLYSGFQPDKEDKTKINFSVWVYETSEINVLKLFTTGKSVEMWWRYKSSIQTTDLQHIYHVYTL